MRRGSRMKVDPAVVYRGQVSTSKRFPIPGQWDFSVNLDDGLGLDGDRELVADLDDPVEPGLG